MSEVADTPRKRFAKSEIAKILAALEMVDGHDLDLGMRVLYLEDELNASREDTRRWRVAYERTYALLVETSSMTAEAALERLEAATRAWVGRA